MPHETVPADIAAAIEKLKMAEYDCGRWSMDDAATDDQVSEALGEADAARAALNAAILKELNEAFEAGQDQGRQASADF